MMKTRLLLDTCALIWAATNAQLSRQANDALQEAADEGNTIAISAISAWELGLLSARGRLPGTKGPMAMFQSAIEQSDVELAPLDPSILIESSFLPGDIHSDSADRIIIATARANDFTVVTRDSAILDYARQGYVRAIAC
jgi:PIN domain nuclease of toxin-antitoxin system